MKLYPLETAFSDSDTLEKDYRNAREIGIIRLGDSCLFFRNKLRIYYIPYTDIRRCFRRVMLVRASLCCGKGNLEVENLVICTDKGEAAQIQLPGTRAAKILIDEVKQKAPDAKFTRPDAEKAQEE